MFWNPPNGTSEFDKYQISLGSNRRLAPVTRNRDDENRWEFKDLEPGKTYQVVVKTVSGKVTSWPASGDVTLSTCSNSYFLSVRNISLVIIYNYSVSSFFVILIGPLPVHDLRAVIDEKTGMVEVSWSPENLSTQDSYKLQYHEVETTIGGDSNTLTTDKTKVSISRIVKKNPLPFIYFSDIIVKLIGHAGSPTARKKLFHNSSSN